jgi:LysM repeat protein
MKFALLRVLLALTVLCTPLLLDEQVAFAQDYVTIVTQPGDTLSKIAVNFCTTWQEIYNMNAGVIGPDPNQLEPGTVLVVNDECYSDNSGSSGSSGNTDSIGYPCAPPSVYDRGPSTGASGTFYAPYYTVAWGDDVYSIASRFGVSPNSIRQANDLWDDALYVGMQLIIPGFCTSTPPAPSVPSGAERVQFSPGAVSASRVGQTAWGQPKSYVLTAMDGQRMEIYTSSHGGPLSVTVTNPNGGVVQLSGTNNSVQNSLWLLLQSTGDYVITVAPVQPPEGPTLTFDITFIVL